MRSKRAVLATIAFSTTLLGPWTMGHAQSARARSGVRSPAYRGRSVRTSPYRGASQRAVYRGGYGSYNRGRSYTRRPTYGHYRTYRPSYRYRGYYRPYYYRPYSYYRPYYYRPYSYYRPYVSWGLGWGWPGWGYWGWPSFGIGVGGYLGTVSYYGGGATQYSYQNGAVQLKVKPKAAEVYVDGYYAGVVDDFDGSFQRLYMPPGQHDIEIRLEGYRPHQQSLHINSGQTSKIHHDLEPLLPGETTPAPPEPVRPREAKPETPPTKSATPAPPREVEAQAPRPEEPRPPERPRPAASTRFGTLAVRVQPAEALIIIDGEPWGTSAGFEELTIHLRAGGHTVEMRLSGYESFVTDVEVEAGQTTPLNVRLPGAARF